jgi:hypothetical protein
MNTHDLDNPFGERLLEGTLDVAGRSVVVLRELTEGESGNLRTGQTDDTLEQTEPESAPDGVAKAVEETAVLEEV